MRRLAAVMFSLGIMAFTGLMTYVNFPTSCTAGKPPVVHVSYESTLVKYDYSKSEAELSATKSDTVNPYGPGAVTSTEGLRRDQPTIETKSSENMMMYPVQHLFCIGYDTVDVTIRLKPVIYIASRWRPGQCQDAILEHEQKHVAVDHEVMDEFVPRIKAKVEAAVRATGTMGPLNMDEQDRTQSMMTEKIATAVNGELNDLHKVMIEKQSHVDTLQEYERVSKICEPER